MVGIYKITNPEGKIYVGLSKEIEKRWTSHKNLQFKGNELLRESLIKYGEDSHLFEVIEEIEITNLERSQANALLRKRERYWINELNSFCDGLNQNGGGSGCKSHTEESKRKIGEANSKPKPKDFGKNRRKWQHTEEFKAKLRAASRNKREILMYDMEGNFIMEFPSIVDTAKYLGCKPSQVGGYLNQHPNRNGKPPTHVKQHTFKYK